MGLIADMHYFRLCEKGVSCDENGLLVGPVRVLFRLGQVWRVQSSDELERELTSCSAC